MSEVSANKDTRKPKSYSGISLDSDTFLKTISDQLEPIISLHRETETSSAMAAAKDLSDGLTSVKPVKVNPAKGDPAAECEDGSLDIAACCAQFTLDQEKAHFAHSTALSAAYAAFEAELMNWNQACAQYKFATSTAKSALLKAAGDARTAFIAKDNADSSACRIHYFFATLQEAVAAAIQVYEAALAGAATTLAAEAGNVFAAYAAYAGAANNAAAARLVSDATAEQAFWQGIEQARDGS